MDGAEYWFDPEQTLLEVAHELAAASGWQLIEPDGSCSAWRMRRRRPSWSTDPDLP